MTGKQRAYLRGLANSIDAKFQIGKGGVDFALTKHSFGYPKAYGFGSVCPF
ncbi:MAG: YhbY family RNA-binding protein [Clostridia bacterium]|nr:YhbY family RNA-binding protein [Clostridia bacterium]